MKIFLVVIGVWAFLIFVAVAIRVAVDEWRWRG